MNICEVVRRMEQDFTSGKTTISKYVDWSLYETIEKIYAYLNSKHISGRTDSKNRIKPFFNICQAAVNVWYRATDIDRKHIRVKAKKQEHYTAAFVATLLLQKWMRQNFFGKFLNQWGRTLSQFGSAVVKMVEKNGELRSEIVPWNRIICDAVDFEGNPVIEKLYFTPAQLRKKKEYDQKLVEKLCDSVQTRRLIDGQAKDSRTGYIEIFEVHGEFSERTYKKAKGMRTKASDDFDYSQQMHVVSFTSKKDADGNFIYEDYTLYCGKEAKTPYILTHLIKEDGRTLAIGAVESLFEAQWMVNHSAKQIKDFLDLASKLIYQTSDGNFVGQNVLTAIGNGDILVHANNQPLAQIATTPYNISALQNYADQWRMIGREQTSTPEVTTGETMPSGTAYRQVALLQQEAHSLFEMMTENKGLELEYMLIEYVLPNLKRKMDTTEEISEILESYQVNEIDTMFIPNEAIRRNRKKIIDKVLSDEDTRDLTPEWQAMDIEQEKQSIQQDFAQLGNQRFIKPSEIKNLTWKESLKDLEWELEIEVTNETVDKHAVYDTLNTVLNTISSNQMILQDKNARLIFNRILEETGKLSPIELASVNSAMSNPVSPAVAGSVAGQQQKQMMIQ